jgi:hypothetical protein
MTGNHMPDNKPYSKFVVVVFCHSRYTLLDESLRSICSAAGFENWTLVIVQQEGSLLVQHVLDSHAENISYLLRFKPLGEKTLENINFSRVLGTDFSFRNLGAEIVLGIEEDTSISWDALRFIELAHELHKTNRGYRGVNLASFYPYTENEIDAYSKLRFGLVGQAGAINRKSWSALDFPQLLNLRASEEWASHIEGYLKTGFMIHPVLSRMLDQGWGGTSDPNSLSSNSYFTRIRKSFVPGAHVLSSLVESRHRYLWREDAITFKKCHNVYFYFRRFRSARLLYGMTKILRLPHIRKIIFDKWAIGDKKL